MITGKVLSGRIEFAERSYELLGPAIVIILEEAEESTDLSNILSIALSQESLLNRAELAMAKDISKRLEERKN